MKIRIGFVSNSSSSSFVVDKNKITKEQYDAILDPISYIKNRWPEQMTKDREGDDYHSLFGWINDTGLEHD